MKNSFCCCCFWKCRRSVGAEPEQWNNSILKKKETWKGIVNYAPVGTSAAQTMKFNLERHKTAPERAPIVNKHPRTQTKSKKTTLTAMQPFHLTRSSVLFQFPLRAGNMQRSTSIKMNSPWETRGHFRSLALHNRMCVASAGEKCLQPPPLNPATDWFGFYNFVVFTVCGFIFAIVFPQPSSEPLGAHEFRCLHTHSHERWLLASGCVCGCCFRLQTLQVITYGVEELPPLLLPLFT